MPRVAIAGFQHETNTFSPLATGLEHYEQADSWPGLTSGADVLSVFPKINIPIGGFVKAAADWDLVPILWASAEPGAPADAETYDTIANRIVAEIATEPALDGIYLDLHGAMVTQDHEDGEGELLRRIRNVVGMDFPIAVSLDLHANISRQCFDLASVIVIFREYPHLDMASTGARAAGLLRKLIEDGKPFKKAFQQVPYLIPLSSQATGAGPMKLIYDAIPPLIEKNVVSADAASGFPPADIKDCGPSVLAYGSNQSEVDAAVDALMKKFLDTESLFEDNLYSSTEAARLAAGHSGVRPLVLADVQDNPGAGGTSETTGLIHALVAEGCRQTALGVVWDVQTAQLAANSGVGTNILASLGGRYGSDRDPPFEGTFRVEALSDGRFICTGAMYRDCAVDLGQMTCLRLIDSRSDIRLIVSSKRFQCLDLAIFRHMGIEPTEQSVLGVKSTVHFLDDFEPIADQVLFVEAKGSQPCRLDRVTYRNLRPNMRYVPS